MMFFVFFFFFQAEDGIRDLTVTGVQTCALPICEKPAPVPPAKGRARKQTPPPAPDQPQKLTNPDRLLYPKDRITKADVAAYYDAVAPALLNALMDRPLTLVHWNQGIEKPSWFQQDVGAMAEDWMRTAATPARTTK